MRVNLKILKNQRLTTLKTLELSWIKRDKKKKENADQPSNKKQHFGFKKEHFYKNIKINSNQGQNDHERNAP